MGPEKRAQVLEGAGHRGQDFSCDLTGSLCTVDPQRAGPCLTFSLHRALACLGLRVQSFSLGSAQGHHTGVT